LKNLLEYVILKENISTIVMGVKSLEVTNLVKEEQVVVFKLGNEFYGIDIFKVKEIIRYTEITSVPSVPDFVEGIINLRGKVIPVLDLRKTFQLDYSRTTQDSRIIIVELSGHVVGLIVDEVEEVIRLNSDIIEMPPSLTNVMAKYVKGVGKLEERLLILLELDELVAKDKVEELKQL